MGRGCRAQWLGAELPLEAETWVWGAARDHKNIRYDMRYFKIP